MSAIIAPDTDGNMDLSSIFTFVGGLTYLSFAIYRANQEQISNLSSGVLRWLLYGVAGLTFLYGLFILEIALSPISTDSQLASIDQTSAILNFVLTASLSLLSMRVIASEKLRERIRRILPASATYSPDSPVHTTACVLILAVISFIIGNFVVSGGIAGLAQDLQSNGVGFGDLFFQEVLWIFAAALGIGLFLRRTAPQAFARLGLRIPTRQDINWGIGIGLLLFGLVIATSSVWSLLVSPQELQQQTAASDQLAQSFNSLPVAFITSVVVAIGEEIFFRGALQPVFGIWLTSLIFAVIHTQYTLTPATLIIFVTSLGLGWLRQRYSTSASIVGHFVYNFIQLALAVLVGTSI
jgi:CAAX protease family protein